MCPVAADLATKSLLDTCGRARHTCAPAAHYYICVNITYLLLDLHGVTDKTYSVCAAHQRPPIFFFCGWSLLQDCRKDGPPGLQLSYLAVRSSCNIGLTHDWETPLLTEGHRNGTPTAWQGFCLPEQKWAGCDVSTRWELLAARAAPSPYEARCELLCLGSAQW